MPSLLDILPPEAQHLLGSISLVAALAGLILWATGVKIARLSVALFLGLVASAAGASQLPHDIGITPVTAALLGFVAGALLGALAFKILQGLVLALCIGVAAAGIFYYWHTSASAPTVQAAHTQPAPAHSPDHQITKSPDPALASAQTQPTDKSLLAIKDLEVPTYLLSQKAPAATAPAPSTPLAAFRQKLLAHWRALPDSEQRPLLVISLSAAVLTLLLSFSFPNQATWLASAVLGSMLLFLTSHTAIKLYAPQYESYFPATSINRYLALALLTSIGLLIQYKFFWPRSTRPNPLPPMENPLHRGPAPQAS